MCIKDPVIDDAINRINSLGNIFKTGGSVTDWFLQTKTEYALLLGTTIVAITTIIAATSL